MRLRKQRTQRTTTRADGKQSKTDTTQDPNTYTFFAPAARRARLGASGNTNHGGRWLFTQSAAREDGIETRRQKEGAREGRGSGGPGGCGGEATQKVAICGYEREAASERERRHGTGVCELGDRNGHRARQKRLACGVGVGGVCTFERAVVVVVEMVRIRPDVFGLGLWLWLTDDGTGGRRYQNAQYPSGWLLRVVLRGGKGGGFGRLGAWGKEGTSGNVFLCCRQVQGGMRQQVAPSPAAFRSKT
ncbi:uncharacterized protein SPSK_05504 [Sporothrix schenckii 1099-18]|uniref:Uncharacterized protein n=1 Tax=Sporothrix schenckii 1099-18 TaxID=1397361 RepID=A0A0F2LWV0_SPOSC|nr:uncharacterized protein SPSK_05504 [Sporothrix schenckii 1099-18]KJR80960.1 hypothetical protein SPSK_05504 [Sporothrix schenckii 1099-18]